MLQSTEKTNRLNIKAILNEFFDFGNANSTVEHLWEMYSYSLESMPYENLSPQERSKMFTDTRELEYLLQNLYTYFEQIKEE